MKIFKLLSVIILGTGIIACDNQQSLQEYYVTNQGNKEFIAVDLPASMLANMQSLNADQRKTLETVKKINFLAIPQKPENLSRIAEEKNKVNNILKDERYQLLMKFGKGETKMELYYTGDEEAVNEVILYGYDENKGMGIARLLGQNMNPGHIMNLISSMEKGDIDLSGVSGVSQIFSGMGQ